MRGEWSEDAARKLCGIAVGLILLCLAVVADGAAGHFGVWRPHDLGTAGNVLLWTFLALGFLFALDKGIPREGRWSYRLWLLRKVLLIALLAAVAVLAYLR
jgi:hypothetical protein